MEDRSNGLVQEPGEWTTIELEHTSAHPCLSSIFISRPVFNIITIPSVVPVAAGDRSSPLSVYSEIEVHTLVLEEKTIISKRASNNLGIQVDVGGMFPIGSRLSLGMHGEQERGSIRIDLLELLVPWGITLFIRPETSEFWIRCEAQVEGELDIIYLCSGFIKSGEFSESH